MKKFLLVSLAVLAMLSCKKDNPVLLPEIDNVLISGGFNPSTSALTIGNSLTFSLDAENVASCKWYVDGALEGEEMTFVFTPSGRGSYTIKVVAANESNDTVEQTIGTIRVVDPAPIISSLTCDGDPIGGDLEINVGGELEFSVFSTNVTISGYEWSVNGEAVDATTSTYTFTSDWSGDYEITVALKNLDDIATEESFTVSVNGPYKNGVVFYSTSTANLAFQSSSNYYTDLASTATGGESLTFEDVYISDNIIYFLTSYKKILACDAQTFKKIEEYGDFSTTGIGYSYRFIKAAENKFYISTEKAVAGGGLWSYQKQGDDYVMSATAIAGTANAPYSKPIKVGDYILVGNGDDIAVIDPSTDMAVPHSKNGIEIDAARKIRDVVRGRDGYIYAVAYGSSTVTSSVIKIDPADFSFIEETELLEGTNKVYQSFMAGARAAASLSSNHIFIMGAGGIYKYDYQGKSTSLFATGSGTALNYMQMGVDQENLYVGSTNYSTSEVQIYNIQTGVKTALPSRVPGDASIMSTYQFAGM